MRTTANWLREATRLRNLGLAVIPLHSPDLPTAPAGDKKHSIGKTPLVRWQEYQERLPSVQEICEWGRRWPDANLGVVTGLISGVIVLDSDGHEGANTLEDLGPIPRTWRDTTGRGEHLWFKHPGGVIRNFTRRLPGLDLRADGGYVVVPPSRHRTGRPYRWVVAPEDVAPAEPPDWLTQLVGAPQPASPPSELTPGGWVAEALLQGAPEGSRDSTCTRLAGFFLGCGVNPETTTVILSNTFAKRCRPPFPVADVRKCVKSIARRELMRQSKPGAIDALDLLAKEFPQRSGWITGIIERESLSVLGGPPKVFKTALVTGLALRVATGTPWLGVETAPGRVLMLQAEIAEQHFQARLRLMTDSLGPLLKPDTFLVASDRQAPLDTAAGQARIHQLLAQHHPDLLIIDPLARFLTGDENRAQDMNVVVRFLDDLIQTLRLSVVLVHHTGKPTGAEREGGQRLRGSSVLFAAADSVLMLDRIRGEYVLSFQLRHAAAPAALTLTPSDSLWLEPGVPERLSAVVRLATNIRYSALRDVVMTDLKVSKATATRLIADAKRSHLIEQVDGRYVGSQVHQGSSGH